jgi:DNA-binding transcriptional ArsR family regulator
MNTPQILSELRMYAGLDSESRLRAYLALSETPGISFNDLARKIRLEKGLLAYHLGVLKAAGLVEMKYERMSKKTSRYYPTEEGKKILRRLVSK